jgi:cytochrome o ubiquinol oxidase operon protein cyoD
MILCLVLTFASFGAVMTDVVPKSLGMTAIVVLCIAQLIVQLVYFLHLGTARDARANTGVFISTAFLIVIIVGMSFWVMNNANEAMMPQMHMGSIKEMPADGMPTPAPATQMSMPMQGATSHQ